MACAVKTSTWMGTSLQTLAAALSRYHHLFELRVLRQTAVLRRTKAHGEPNQFVMFFT